MPRQILLTALSINMIVCVYYGMGQHILAFTSLDDIVELSKITYSWTVLSSVVFFVTKLCVASFLFQLVVSRSHKTILWISAGICGILAIAQIITLLLVCNPFRYKAITALFNSCSGDIFIVNYFLSAYGIFLDFFYAFLPIFFFRSLQIPRREKIVVCASLATGVFAGIAGIIRLVFIIQFDSSARATDPFYDAWKSIVWTHTENTTSLICVCFPAIRTLYARLRKEPEDRIVSKESDSSRPSERSKRTSILHKQSHNSKDVELTDLFISPIQTSSSSVGEPERRGSIMTGQEILPGILTMGDPAQMLGSRSAVTRRDSDASNDSVNRIVGANEDRIIARYSYTVSSQPQV
ncbi:hypothetical protein NX059_009482 [Plenodomus lindquistii]|nr:hypothetical protein NX059_009482 [Plenodomus lindquistii]